MNMHMDIMVVVRANLFHVTFEVMRQLGKSFPSLSGANENRATHIHQYGGLTEGILTTSPRGHGGQYCRMP